MKPEEVEIIRRPRSPAPDPPPYVPKEPDPAEVAALHAVKNIRIPPE